MQRYKRLYKFQKLFLLHFCTVVARGLRGTVLRQKLAEIFK